MMVSTPNRYVDLRRGSSRFVPCWLPASAEALFEIRDPWSFSRLTDGKHGSLYHVTLPDALELPVQKDDLPFGAVGVDGRTLYFEEFDHLPYTGTDIVTYKVYSSAVLNGLYGVLVIDVDNRVSWQRHRWAGSIRPVFFVFDHEADGLATLFAYSAPSWQFDRIYQETVTVADVIEWSITKCAIDFGWHSTWTMPITSLPNHYTQEIIQQIVNSRVNACLRFEENKLADDVVHLEADYNPLRKKHWINKRAKSRGRPLWVQSNATFLKGKAAAYVDALEDVPVLSANTLQNIASVYQVLSHFAFDADGTIDVFNKLAETQSPITAQGLPRLASVELPEIPQHAKSAWLGGRYVFSTSVADGESAWNYFYDLALKEMKTRSRGHKCHGKATVDNATFTCTFHITEKNLSGALDFYDNLYRLGLEPNAYVMWDFVPYSFVADWFLPIGDALNAYTLADHYSPLYYTYDPIYADYSFCYTVKYSVQDPLLGKVTVFCRWYESTPPDVEAGMFLISGPEASTKTQCWRLVDALCLVL